MVFNKGTFLQFIKFGIVGISNTLVAWACYYLIIWINEELYMLGSVFGNVVGIANAYFWNDKYVFKSDKNDNYSKLRRLGKTYISYSGTAILGMLLLWVEVRFLGISQVIAPPLNLMIITPLNYLINKYWTFEGKS